MSPAPWCLIEYSSPLRRVTIEGLGVIPSSCTARLVRMDTNNQIHASAIQRRPDCVGDWRHVSLVGARSTVGHLASLQVHAALVHHFRPHDFLRRPARSRVHRAGQHNLLHALPTGTGDGMSKGSGVSAGSSFTCSLSLNRASMGSSSVDDESSLDDGVQTARAVSSAAESADAVRPLQVDRGHLSGCGPALAWVQPAHGASAHHGT